MPTSPTPVTALPTPPSTTDPVNFDARGDALLGAMPTMVTEMNALADVCYSNANEAEAAVIAAAEITAAEMFVSGATYVTGQAAVSALTYRAYRRRSPGGVATSDPALDAANWLPAGPVATIADATQNAQGTSNSVYTTPLGVRQALNATGSTAPIFAARAFVTITGSSGTIKATGNIGSVTRLGAGRYRCTFSITPGDANYAVLVSTNQSNTAAGASDAPDSASYTNKSSTGFDFTTWNSTASDPDDMFEVSVVCFW